MESSQGHTLHTGRGLPQVILNQSRQHRSKKAEKCYLSLLVLRFVRVTSQCTELFTQRVSKSFEGEITREERYVHRRRVLVICGSGTCNGKHIMIHRVYKGSKR